MFRRWTALSSIVAAGATFVVLDVIIGIALWVSLLAAGCVLVAGAFATAASSARADERLRLKPVVHVRSLRQRFALALAVGLGAAFLVVASFAVSASTAAVLGWAVGIGLVALSLALSPTVRRTPTRVAAWDAIAAACTALSGWQVVQALVFAPATARWLTFADACGLAGLALGALVLHELSTERVVHALELVERKPAERAEAVIAGA